ncbi:MAG: alpha/beta hydrolase [Polaromonas sp.]
MTWLLLRGLTREARHWGGFSKQFAAALHLPGSQALTPDLPGNGSLRRQASPASVHGMVEALRQQLRAQGARPPYSLLAMSLGGMAATDWAQRYPQEIARLVLVNTSLRPFSRLSERLRPGSWPSLALLAARWREAGTAENLIHQLTCNRTDSRAADVAAWVRIRHDAPVSAANAGRQLWAAARFSGAAPPRCPVLVLSSVADRLVNPCCSERLAHAWQAGHRQHPWAGHDLPHDDPEWLCRQVTDWVEDPSSCYAFDS